MGRTASVVAFAVVVACIFFLIYTGSLFGDGPISISIQAAAVALMIWARVTFGMRSFHAAANPTEGGLITRGPYRWIRHPIYAAIIYFIWAGVASHWSIVSAMVGLIATAMLFVRMMSEEKLLVERYPEYADYARRTRRLMPFLL